MIHELLVILLVVSAVLLIRFYARRHKRR